MGESSSQEAGISAGCVTTAEDAALRSLDRAVGISSLQSGILRGETRGELPELEYVLGLWGGAGWRYGGSYNGAGVERD